MGMFLMKDLFRIDGATGAFIEKEYADDSMKYNTELLLESAKGQYVSFQIGFQPENGKLDDFQIEFSELKGKDIISKENYSAFVEWFHHVDGALVPDLLIPFEPAKQRFAIPLDRDYLYDQKAGALWVDLFVPKEITQGEYKGTVSVKADGSGKTFTICIRVNCAVVPENSRITADFNNYADSISGYFDSLKHNKSRYTDGSYLRVEKEFYRMSREHRGLFHNLPYKHSSAMNQSFAPELEGEGKYIRVKSWDLFDRHFGPYLDGSAFKGSRVSEEPLEFMYLPFNLGWPANYEKWGQKGYRTEYRRILQEFVRHFEEKGWDKTYLEILLNHKKDYRFYPYTIDEIWYEHDEDVVDVYYDIIKDIYESSHAKFVLRMDSSNHYGNHYDHRFSDMCKMWVAGFSMFNWFPESVEVMKNKGNILWIYGSVLQSLQDSLLSLFVWPVQCVITGATGFCIWNTTGFGDDYLNAPLDLGGQTLFYPGSYFNIEAPLPSIRLKSLRNAMQITALAMQFEGTPDKHKVDQIINKHFGLEGNKDWWRDKPGFINTPPRYWDFEGGLGGACLPPMHKGRNPMIMEAIAHDIYSLINREEEITAKKGNFSFQ